MRGLLVRYNNLSKRTKADVRRRYVNWYLGPYATFTDWAVEHAFYIRNDGLLDNRYNYAEPDFMAD